MLVKFSGWIKSGQSQLKILARSTEWWDYKIAPIMAIFYGTILLQGQSILSVWPTCLELLLVIAACAMYVSLINDLTDKRDDLAAGKHNRLAGKPPWLVALLFACPLSVGLVYSVFRQDDGPLLFAYLGSWVAFSLYSVPPFRFKIRGGLGVLADASGSHLFPTLVAALLAFRATGTDIDPIWLASVGIWAFAAGLRGILWHQLSDVENDRRAGIRTFVVHRSPRVAIRLTRYVTFPVELAALAVMLWKLQSAAPVLCLALYIAFAVTRARIFDQRLIIAKPCARYAIIGQEYYSVLLPVGILASAASRFAGDLIVLGVHLFIFRSTALLVLHESRHIVQNLRTPPDAIEAQPEHDH